MGALSATARRNRRARFPVAALGGGAIWSSALIVVAIAAVFVTQLVLAGSHAVSGAPASTPDLVRSLQASAEVVAIALPVVFVPALLAAASAAETSIGGAVGKMLNASLWVGPVTPAIAFAAAAWWAASHVHGLASNPVLAAGIALAAFNLPIVTVRLREALRELPDQWRVAAVAVGATPQGAFLQLALPQAWPGVVSIALNAASQMIGEAVIFVIFFPGGPQPLTADLFARLTTWSRPDDVAVASTETVLLVIVVVALRFVARLTRLGLRPRRAAA